MSESTTLLLVAATAAILAFAGGMMAGGVSANAAWASHLCHPYAVETHGGPNAHRCVAPSNGDRE